MKTTERSGAADFMRLRAEDILLPYQSRWALDNSPFKIGLWARQTGKDFSCAAEAVMHSIRHPKTVWAILAAGERQALESVAKAKEWAQACQYAVENYRETKGAGGAEALLQAAEITWQNGSRLLALPANPATVRGYSANLILTEFAFYEKPEETWRAIYPSISNPLRGGAKRLRIISTPNGRGNKFHDLWVAGNYARHRVTIREAVAQGLPLNVEELRAGLNDPEGWAQEYECEFVDSSVVLLTYELIARCEDAGATEAPAEEPCPRGVFLGIDFGRSRDRTVCWMLERAGGALWTREVLVLAGMATPEQIEALAPRVRRAARVCLDATGAGTGMGDYLVRDHGEFREKEGRGGKIELCHFTAPFKADLFSRLRFEFERGAVRIPAGREIREDLHGVRRVITPSGNTIYRAADTPDGHSDRCLALALAIRAASLAGGGGGVEVVPRPRMGRGPAAMRGGAYPH